MPEAVPTSPSFFSALGAFIASGTGRRLLVFSVGFLVVTLNKKLGLDLNPEALISDIVLVVGYLAQSSVKEASDAHAEAKLVSAQALAAPGLGLAPPPAVAP